MTTSPERQTLDEFFDSPQVLNARCSLSASAAEPVSTHELLAFEPDAATEYSQLELDYPWRHAPAELREQVAERYEGFNMDNVAITSGVDEGLAFLFATLVEPGDRVVVLTPCYPPHLAIPHRRGAEVVPWCARQEDNWVPDLDGLRDLLCKPTRMVIATFPQNPTGFMPDDAYFDKLMDVVHNSGAVLIADEVYAGLPSGENALPRFACRHHNAISLGGLSKSTGLPGLRVGWMVTNNLDVLNRVNKEKLFYNCYLPRPVEFLAAIALRHENKLLDRNTKVLAAGVAAAKGFFDRHNGLFSWTPPVVGVLSFPQWSGPGGTKQLSDRLLNEASIVMAPSLCFDAGDSNFRLGLCRRDIPAVLDHFEEFLSKNYP